MMTLFALSLPGLVVILTFVALSELLPIKVKGNRRPRIGGIGLDILGTAFQPRQEYLVQEKESRKLLRDEDEEGAPPFDHTLKKITIRR